MGLEKGWIERGGLKGVHRKGVECKSVGMYLTGGIELKGVLVEREENELTDGGN